MDEGLFSILKFLGFTAQVPDGYSDPFRLGPSQTPLQTGVCTEGCRSRSPGKDRSGDGVPIPLRAVRDQDAHFNDDER